jgi:response regulator RpfG family c-di-GMP phosphodiesterase
MGRNHIEGFMEDTKSVSKVLLVDDEPDLLTLYEEILGKQGFQIDSAQDVSSAIEKLKLQTYDMVVADVGLPGTKGTEIVSWARLNSPQTKVMLITGLSKEDAFESLQLGCSGFLMKPLSPEELIAGVSSTLHLGENLELLSADALARVSVRQFLMGQRAPFPLYLKMPDGRFVKLANQGQEMHADGLEKFERGDVHRLHLKKENVAEYMGVCTAASKMAAGRSDWPFQKRIQLLNHSAEVALENIRLTGLTATSFYSLVKSVKEATKLIPTSLDHGDLLRMLAECDDSLLARSVVSANFSAAIASVMGWTSHRMVDTFVLSTLLKDIGLLTMPESYHASNPAELSPELLKEFKRHPYRGVDLLRGIHGLPKEVLMIVEQHHEGLGADSYPKNLARANMIPLARMVQGIDRFFDIAMDLKSKDELTAKKVLNGIFKLKQEGCERNLCFALEALFRRPSVVRAQDWFRKEVSVHSARRSA